MEAYKSNDNQGKVLQTYIPGSDQENPTDNFNNSLYGEQDFTNMNAGFEAGSMTYVTGKQELKALMAEDVVNKSFLFMVVALIITAGAALTTSPEAALQLLFSKNFLILCATEVAIVLVSEWALSKNNAILGGILFVAYSYLTGVICSVLFLIYTGSSIAVIFFVTAALFGIMAVIGMVTQKDLTSIDSFLVMALFGIIIASLVNLVILRNNMVDTGICVAGVLIFVGMTAYDAQKIKSRVAISNDGNVLSLALMGAFDLYLDFINIFLKLVRLFGKRK